MIATLARTLTSGIVLAAVVLPPPAHGPTHDSTQPPPLDPRVDRERMTTLEPLSPPAPPAPIILPLPPDHRIASTADDVPIDINRWTRAREAIERGIAFLESTQTPMGLWRPGAAATPTNDDMSSPVDVAITSLCVKAIVQTRGAEGDAAARGLRALAAAQHADGSFSDGSLSNYVTATVVSALAGADEFRFRHELRGATEWLIDAQWDQGEGLDERQDWFGGAGYGRRQRPDLSNTQMMLDALYDAGLSPSEPAVERALAFVSRAQNLNTTNPSPWAGTDGGFVYTPAGGGESMASEAAGEGRRGEQLPAGTPRSLRSYGSMTYAGFKSMLFAGLSPKDERVRAAFDWIRRHWTFDENPGLGEQGLYYYYHVLSRSLRSGQQNVIIDINGTRHNWREELIDAVASRQRADGSWRNDADRWMEGEPVLATALAVLALEETLKPVSRFHEPEPSGLRFEITYDPTLAEAYTGRVYVLMTTSGRLDPRFGPRWFDTSPFLAIDVVDWQPGTPLVITNDNAIAFPAPIDEIPTKPYSVQAVMRLNPDAPDLGRGTGNGYSAAFKGTVGGDGDHTVPLHIDQIVQSRPFDETDRIRLVEMRSPMLSAFHGRDIVMRAGVLLPEGYEANPDRRYPVAYNIGGFGSDHRMVQSPRWDRSGYADRIARVFLDPKCFGGHHVFADSANNGPRGTALVEELIPHLEQTFRFVSASTARFVTGHSSGGWSSLWLQVAYPDAFGGMWSTAPDPVDFSRFQRIDVYAAGSNAYTDVNGAPVPVAQRRGRAFATVEEFTAMETVYGDGGQLRSFEWVFSPPSDAGGPKPLYDRATGEVDPVVAESWKEYDIRLKLEREWETIGPKLTGKLTIIVGDADTFYLHHAVVRLKAWLELIGSDAVVEIITGADHGSFMNGALFERIDREMLAVFDRHHGNVPETP